MLAFDRSGQGSPLLLLHATNSTRRQWEPLAGELALRWDVIAPDLPAHGASAPSSLTPPGFAREVAALLDALGVRAPVVAGLSIGGWTALELAKLGRASAVLALAPAGLWARHSPWRTDLGLVVNWGLGRLGGERGARTLRSSAARRAGLRSISAHPERVAPATAVATAQDAARSRHFPEHFRRTRALRFEGGRAIAADVPVRVAFGDEDKVARASSSRRTDELPAHAVLETWNGCGHMLIWDAPDRVLSAVHELAPATPPA